MGSENIDSPWQFSCCSLQSVCEGVAHGGDDGLEVLPGVLHHAVTRAGHHVPQQPQQARSGGGRTEVTTARQPRQVGADLQ